MAADRNDREETPPSESTVDGESTAPPGDNGHSTVSWELHDGSGDPTRLDRQGAAGNGRPPDADGSARFGVRYTSVVFVAQGGIGRVWKARDGLLGRDVALKEIRPELAGDLRVERRFREEARITAGLEHPNIITMHDLSADPARPFYTMRFLGGGQTLKQAVVDHYRRTAGATPPARDFRGLLDAFLDVCHALAFAHSKGVIHRDLKGQNIMLGPFGEVAVLDWGLARELGSAEDPLARPTILLEELPAEMSRTMEGYPIGTIQYMPPEQAAGRREAIDMRSDVFGLGAILYLILTGHPPYEGSSTTETLQKALNVEFPRPSTVKPGTPPALEGICLRAMAAKPEDRYQSAEALAAEVRRWLADEPVSAYPDTGFRTIARWARKHQPVVVGATALLATATIALTVSTVMIASERDKAETAELKSNRSFEVVQDAMPKFLDMMTETSIARKPELLGFRRRVIQQAMLLTMKLNEIAPDDPRFRRLEVRIVRDAATLERLDDRFGPASDHWERALVLMRGLVRDGPDPTGDIVRLAEVLKEKASLDLSLGHFDKAAKGYREAARLVEPTASGATPSPSSLRVLSWNLVRLSYVLRETGHPREALDKARDAMKALQSVPIAIPDDKRDFAEVHQAIGRALVDLGSRSEAKVEFDEAVRLAKVRLAGDKDHPDAQFDLSGALLGRVAFLATDFLPPGADEARADPVINPVAREAAIVDARKAIDLTEQLLNQYRNVSYFRRAKAYAQVILGGLLLDLGSLDEAEGLANEARDEMQLMANRKLGLVADQQVLGQAFGLIGRIDRRRGRVKEATASLGAAIACHVWVLDLNKHSPDDIAGKARAENEKSRLPTR